MHGHVHPIDDVRCLLVLNLVKPAPVPTSVAPTNRRVRVVPRARPQAKAESFYLAAYQIK